MTMRPSSRSALLTRKFPSQDTAYMYRDEGDIATGIAAAGVSTSSLFITTKIKCGTYKAVRVHTHQRPSARTPLLVDEVALTHPPAFAQSAKEIDDNLSDLKVSAVNLTLIHFPECFGMGSVADTWRALEDAKAAGKTAAIGVSNFSPDQLRKLQKTAKARADPPNAALANVPSFRAQLVVLPLPPPWYTAQDWPPALNQCSLSVGYHDDATIKYCDDNKIAYMAYSPLCGGPNGSSCRHGSVMSLPQVKQIASAHSVSPAQACPPSHFHLQLSSRRAHTSRPRSTTTRVVRVARASAAARASRPPESAPSVSVQPPTSMHWPPRRHRSRSSGLCSRGGPSRPRCGSRTT